MRIVTLILLMFATLVISMPINAHKMKSAFTIVLFNERTGFLEVMHRFTLHDAEEAAWNLFDKGADIISKEETQAQFANYIEKKFALKNGNNQNIKLDIVGYQNDAGYFWVYQESQLPTDINKLKIKYDALREVWSEQINVVNIEGKGEVQSLSFSGSDTWLTARFNP